MTHSPDCVRSYARLKGEYVWLCAPNCTAAAEPQAAPLPKRAVELIEDMRHFIKATSKLWESLPKERSAGHLAGIASGLVERANEVLADTERGSEDQ